MSLNWIIYVFARIQILYRLWLQIVKRAKAAMHIFKLWNQIFVYFTLIVPSLVVDEGYHHQMEELPLKEHKG